MLFGILIFDPNRSFWQGYCLCKMTDFQIGVIFGIFGFFFERFFTHNYFNMLVESISAYLFEFYFLTQIDHFGKAIAFAKWRKLKMVSFLEYLVVFGAAFLHKTTLMC